MFGIGKKVRCFLTGPSKTDRLDAVREHAEREKKQSNIKANSALDGLNDALREMTQARKRENG